jgi:hypothetical protein
MKAEQLAKFNIYLVYLIINNGVSLLYLEAQ